MERCRFWPVCKSGDECLYHHPTTQCKWVLLSVNPRFAFKYFYCFAPHQTASFVSFIFLFSWRTFPNCKFGDKCLFIHPNCKYDARCTKPDCPFTHVSRRGTAAPPPKPGALTPSVAPSSINQINLQSVCFWACVSNLSDHVHSSAASADHQCVSLLPRVQKDGLPVLPSKGEASWGALITLLY